MKCRRGEEALMKMSVLGGWQLKLVLQVAISMSLWLCLQDYDLLDTAECCHCSFMGEFSANVGVSSDTVKAVCGSSSSSCSSECRDLLISTCSELGCCISSIYNDSTSPAFQPAPFSSSLWSSCGIEPVSAEGPPGTVALPPTKVDPTCDGETFSVRLTSLNCRKYIDAAHEIATDIEECIESGECNANRFGTYCHYTLSGTRNKLHCSF